MELKDIVVALEESIKLKTEEFNRLDKEHANAKTTFLNELRAIELMIRKNTPLASEVLDTTRVIK